MNTEQRPIHSGFGETTTADKVGVESARLSIWFVGSIPTLHNSRCPNWSYTANLAEFAKKIAVLDPSWSAPG